jgi:hypothetical protein
MIAAGLGWSYSDGIHIPFAAAIREVAVASRERQVAHLPWFG